MKIMFNFHHWSRRGYEAKAQQRSSWQIICGLLSFSFTNIMEMTWWCSSQEFFKGSLKKYIWSLKLSLNI